MDSKGPKFSRREILASSVVLPLVVARPGVVLARGASSESAPEGNALPTAPKPPEEHDLRILAAPEASNRLGRFGTPQASSGDSAGIAVPDDPEDLLHRSHNARRASATSLPPRPYG